MAFVCIYMPHGIYKWHMGSMVHIYVYYMCDNLCMFDVYMAYM